MLAVHRAPYAVSPGSLLLVLVPGRRRRRRGVTVHGLAATGLQGPRRKPPEEARRLLAPEGPRCSRHSAPCCPEACWAECPPNIPIRDRSPDDSNTPTPRHSTRHGHSHNCYWSASLDRVFHLLHMLCWTVQDMIILPYDFCPTVGSLEAIPTPGWRPTTLYSEVAENHIKVPLKCKQLNFLDL